VKSITNAMRANFWIRFAASAVFFAAAWGAAMAQPQPYASGVVVAVYRQNVAGAAKTVELTPSRLLDLQSRQAKGVLPNAGVPRYTNDTSTNRVLLSAGVQRSQRLFGPAKIRINAVYRLTIFGRSVQSAIARIRTAPGVASVTPDWYVSPMAH
jgi:hypothetical protein